MTAEIIADGVHVAVRGDPGSVGRKGIRNGAARKRRNRRHRNADGNYRLGNFEVNVQDGVAETRRKARGKHAHAGSRAAKSGGLGVPLVDAVRMVTVLPARRLGLAGKKGVIAAGADADMVVLNADLRIAGVMTRGVGAR